MKNIHFNIILFLFALISSCNSTQKEVKNDPKSPPNIVLILTDDQGYGDLNFHKNDSVDTPVLDKLASESIRMDRFYVSPVCAPTRASLLTGRYHLITGVSWVIRGAENMRE
ncbi:MAG: sulfatase-like hydrolase/transferase, partial [Flammeovirgaceae bacterium]|nr:sulfatase-like hydrolase/transferase [Flammeovirgaceae bacterium]